MLRTVALLGLLVACNPPPAPPAPPPIPGSLDSVEGDVLAVVDGYEIKQGLLDALTAQMPAPQRDAARKDDTFKQRVVDSLIERHILYSQAIDEKLHEDPDVEIAIDLAARDVLASALLARVGNAAATEEAVKQAYERKKLEYHTKQTRLEHIVVRDATVAAEVAQKLRDGAPWGALAAQYSIDPDVKKHGGDLGWLRQPPPYPGITEVWDTAKPGELIGPVAHSVFFHLFRIQARRDGTPFEEAKPQIEAELWERAARSKQKDATLGAKVERKDGKQQLLGPDGPIPAPPAAPGAAHGPGDGHDHGDAP